MRTLSDVWVSASMQKVENHSPNKIRYYLPIRHIMQSKGTTILDKKILRVQKV